LLAVRSDTKESRESSSKLKSKHKLLDTSSDGERAHKESRHESYDRDRIQGDAEKVQKAQHRDEKRTPADKDGDRSHRSAERDQLSADESMSGNRSGDGHRRSAETTAGKPSDERGNNGYSSA